MNFFAVCDIIFVLEHIKKGGVAVEIIIRCLVFAVISGIADGIYEIFLRKPEKAEKGKVHLPKLFAIIGVIDAALFLTCAAASYFSGEETWVPVVFLVIALVGVVLIVAFANCRITYDDEGFVARTFFGIKRKVTYDQVTAIKENAHETYIYIGKRRVMVDEFSINGRDFIKLVKKKYRTFNGGKNLPLTNKRDIFNGNVKDVSGFIAAYTIVSVVLIGMMILLFMPITEKNTIEKTVCFDACQIESDNVILISADKENYKILFDAEKINIEEIKSVCDGKTSITVYYKEVTPDDGEDFYSVKAIKYNNDYLLSFEETNRLNRQEGRGVALLFLILLLIWVAYIAASVIVGRNPNKFSKKVVKMFFKDGYINY